MNQALATMQVANTAPWLEAAAFGLLLCDAKLTVLQANGRSVDMLGVEAETAHGRHLFNLLELPERQCNQILAALERHEAWQGLSRSGEHALKVEIRGAGDGAVVSLIDYSADLEHLQRLNDAKTMAEKSNDAKSQFLQHMSHELRTPLNAIIGFTQLLKISTGLDARELDNVAEIEKAGGSLLTLITEILDLSKIEAGKLKLSEAHVDLAALAQECVQLLAPTAAPRQIRIETRIDGDGLLVADYVRLKQILMNLLSNAIKYNVDGGTVSLHSLGVSDNRTRLEIRDSGVGIAPEHLQTIFSPFDRLGSIEGSGIGLMITRRLVTLMQGQIGVFSVPERGSVFWVELPKKRLSVLESMLQDQEREAEAPAVAGPQGPLFWIGARTALFTAFEGLRELRPGLSLRHYDSVADAASALQLETPGMVLVRHDAATAAELESLSKQLKGAPLHVVTDSRECRNPPIGDNEPGGHGQSVVPVTEDAKLTALLDLLDCRFAGSKHEPGLK
jgi:signal transduction histidine kinase